MLPVALVVCWALTACSGTVSDDPDAPSSESSAADRRSTRPCRWRGSRTPWVRPMPPAPRPLPPRHPGVGQAETVVRLVRGKLGGICLGEVAQAERFEPDAVW